MKVRIKKLVPEAVVPSKATPGSAAYDVRICEDVVVLPMRRQVIPLCFAVEMPYGIEAKIEPRSGFSSKGMLDKDGQRKDADVIQGKVDSDYRGPVGVIVHSHEPYPFTLEKGTAVAQMTFYRVEDADFDEADELSSTERGEGGFGHSGKGV